MNLDSIPTFRAFSDESDAVVFSNLLKEGGFATEIVVDSSRIDSNFIGAASTTLFRVKLRKEDFVKASDFLLHQAEQKITTIPESHYLRQFTKEELEEVVTKSHEWSEQDVVISKMLLQKMGEDSESPSLNARRVDALTAAYQPRKWSNREIIIVYLSLLFLGIAGFVAGLILWRSKKTLPNGAIVFSNAEEARNHGKVVFIIGLIIISLSIVSAFTENS